MGLKAGGLRGSLRNLSTGVSPLPDSEDFEHNDLTGVYAGDTGSFNIQTGTVDQGAYALYGDGGATHQLIVRDTTPTFERGGLRMTWRQYRPSGGSGGVALATSATGHTNAQYYAIFADDNTVKARKWDAGNLPINNSTNTATAAGQWISGSVDILSNSIEATVDGISVSLTDSEYTNLLLAHKVFNDTYVDDVQFESI